MTHCRYHCRGCAAHFTSLEAFDAHREGPAGSDRECSFPESGDLVELTGVCKIADLLTPAVGVTIYATKRAEGVAGRLRALETRQTAPPNVREGALS